MFLYPASGQRRDIFLPRPGGPEARQAAEVPTYHFVKTSKPPPRESRGRAQGRARAEMRESRGPAGMQDESRRPVFRDTLPPATGCRADGRRPRVGPCGERLAKGQMDFARGKPPTRRKTPPEAPFFPAFHTPGNVFAARNSRLCGKKQISFSKEIPFLPHKNARRGGEMLHTNGFPARFLTLRTLFAPNRPEKEGRNSSGILPFCREIQGTHDNLALA